MSRIEPLPTNRAGATKIPWGEELVEAFTGYEYEARSQPRTKVTMEINVRASNGRGNLFGTPFKAISTDISPSGIGFLHTSPVPDKYLAITLVQDGQQYFVLAEVVRCRAVNNLYEIGTQFVAKLERIEG